MRDARPPGGRGMAFGSLQPALPGWPASLSLSSPPGGPSAHQSPRGSGSRLPASPCAQHPGQRRGLPSGPLSAGGGGPGEVTRGDAGTRSARRAAVTPPLGLGHCPSVLLFVPSQLLIPSFSGMISKVSAHFNVPSQLLNSLRKMS